MNKLMAMVNKFNNSIITGKRINGNIYLLLKDNSPEWMTEAIHKAHGDRLPDDDVYDRIGNILNHFAGCDEDSDIDTLRDSISEIEPDIYTADLTAWLHSRVDNVYYLTEALEEMEVKDGFQLLAYAQSIYIREIAEALLNAIEEKINDEEEK